RHDVFLPHAGAPLVAHRHHQRSSRRLREIHGHGLRAKREREQHGDADRGGGPEQRAELQLHARPFLPRNILAQSALFSTATSSIRSSCLRTRSPETAVTTITTSAA